MKLKVVVYVQAAYDCKLKRLFLRSFQDCIMENLYGKRSSVAKNISFDIFTTCRVLHVVKRCFVCLQAERRAQLVRSRSRTNVTGARELRGWVVFPKTLQSSSRARFDLKTVKHMLEFIYGALINIVLRIFPPWSLLFDFFQGNSSVT